MRKILFNDKFLLTKAVLEGRKTQTRRIVSQSLIDKYEEWYDDVCSIAMPSGSTIETLRDWLLRKHTKYRAGEVVAVAQSYETISNAISKTESKEKAAFYCKVMKVCFPDAIIHKDKEEIAGWYNKMFTRAELMPHQIRITDVRIERLKDISDEDCLREGLEWDGKASQYYAGYMKETGGRKWFGRTPREAFAFLIEKVSGKGTWDANPYVWVYDFELIK